MESFMSGPAISIALWMIAIAAILAFVLPIIFSLINGKISLKSIMGVIILAVLLGLIYVTASDQIPTVLNKAKYTGGEIGLDASLMKYVTAGINSALVLLLIAVASWIILEVVNFVRNLV